MITSPIVIIRHLVTTHLPAAPQVQQIVQMETAQPWEPAEVVTIGRAPVRRVQPEILEVQVLPVEVQAVVIPIQPAVPRDRLPPAEVQRPHPVTAPCKVNERQVRLGLVFFDKKPAGLVQVLTY